MTGFPRVPGQRRPAALVLIASPALEGQLRRARRTGWRGPVVVVSDLAEATEVARSFGAGPPGAQGGSPRMNSGGSRQPAQRLMLDPDRQLVVSDDRHASLTRLEFGLLKALLIEPGRVCRFSDLARQVWGTPHVGDVAQVHSVVKRLRRKLDAIASPVQVQAVRGAGFRAVPRSRAAPSARHDRVTGG